MDTASVAQKTAYGTPFYCPTKKLFIVCHGEQFAGEICPICSQEQVHCSFTHEPVGLFFEHDLGIVHPHLPPIVGQYN